MLKMSDRYKNDYFPHIEVRSLYHTLRSKGISDTRLLELIESLPSRIENLEIKIIPVPKQYSERVQEGETLLNDVEIFTQQLGKVKGKNTVVHDAILLQHIIDKRQNKTTYSNIIEKSKAVVISNDSSLKELSHNFIRGKHTAHLVLKPVEIISYLWLRNKSSHDLSTSVIKQSIMAYTREKLIGHDLWEKFWGN